NEHRNDRENHADGQQEWHSFSLEEPIDLEETVADAEDPGRYVDSGILDLRHEARPNASGLYSADDLALLVGFLLEGKDVLKDDDVALHALNLSDVHDLAVAIAEP